MKRSGWNPTRRNRNIGTVKSGHGQANSLVIPESWRHNRKYYEKLRSPVTVEIGGLTILVEPCLPGFVHAVTVDDIVRVVGLLPADDLAGLRMIVLRQPTRKQRIVSKVWGRLLYYAEFDSTPGPAIVLEAQRPDACFVWRRSLTTDDAEELERLRADGHAISAGRGWNIQPSLEAIRATQLFRTLPHELGHHVEYQRELELSARDTDDDGRIERYFSKPVREREDFAHRYAREAMERLSREGHAPFPRLVDEAAMARWKLDPKWFGLA
jgi:hypothetical protein